jgi:hypothetical protein
MNEIVRLALEEDIGSGDVTTNACVPADRRARGRFLAREPLVLAGTSILDELYSQNRDREGADELPKSPARRRRRRAPTPPAGSMPPECPVACLVTILCYAGSGDSLCGR